MQLVLIAIRILRKNNPHKLRTRKFIEEAHKEVLLLKTRLRNKQATNCFFKIINILEKDAIFLPT